MTTIHEKEVLTTGDVARICHVAPRTVSKWFDTGKLKGYRIPGSRDRRIPRQNLLQFMRAYGMPTDQLDNGRIRVLIVDPSPPTGLIEALSGDGMEVQTAVNGFEAGLAAQQFVPDVMVLKVIDPDEASAICRNVRETESLSAVRIIALTDRGGNGAARAFDRALPLTCRPVELARAIEETTRQLN